jgi:RNA-splicing ligase RtcB
MDIACLEGLADMVWQVNPEGGKRVAAILYASESLVRDMDNKVFEQITNVARLPGILRPAYAMPDAHWGYRFPIGGVAAFDADEGGVISAGGVGFDKSCGVRTRLTGLARIRSGESSGSSPMRFSDHARKRRHQEAPGACEDVRAVVDAAEAAGLARKVAPQVVDQHQGLKSAIRSTPANARISCNTWLRHVWP